ncbi:hypothetical protein D3C73_1472850 [compost metagenome]
MTYPEVNPERSGNPDGRSPANRELFNGVPHLFGGGQLQINNFIGQQALIKKIQPVFQRIPAYRLQPIILRLLYC